jgi:hypothetical protein
MPYALHTLSAPGSLVAGYQRGDEILPSVVQAWGLGPDDVSDDYPGVAAEAPAVPRPVDDSDRGAWVAYAVSRGMDPEEADRTNLSDLMDAYPEDAPPASADHPRPADSARKSDWVTYVNDHPQATAEDQAWAGDDATTKAELQAWQPSAQVGDTVAVAATEQANG